MRRFLIPLVAVLVLALAAALWLFQPWRLVTSSTIDEADLGPGSPEPASSGPDSPGPAAEEPGGSPSPPDPTTDREPEPSRSPTASRTPTPSVKARDLARGTFEDAEHETSGTAIVRRLADGRRVVRLADLDTSNGPDLHVWITDQPSGGRWGSYDDGRYVKLGPLKANRGNQNYVIPKDAKLSGLTSVVIWCDRFNVAFGTAPVEL